MSDGMAALIKLAQAAGQTQQRSEAAGDSPAAIAQVRVVVPLDAEEERRIQAYLERLTGHPIQLEIRLDSSILGGVWIRMDDIVIDGSVRARLEALHDRLCASCRLPSGAGPTPRGDSV